MSSANSSAGLDLITGYLECIAESDRDPDVQGYAVRLSTFIANVCLAILVTWSAEDVQESVYVILIQVYTIMLATFISLWRQKLSIADAHFALSLTISPLSIYFIYSTTRWMLNKSSNLYSRLGKSSRMIAFLTVVMVVQWIVLDIIIYAAPDHVFKGQRCTSASFVGWLFYRIFKTTVSLNFSFIFIPVFPFMYILYSIRHIMDIIREHRRHQKKVKKWRLFRFVQVPWAFMRSWTLSNWIVVTYSHRWMIFLLVLIAYLTWAGGVGVWIPDFTVYWNNVVVILHEDDGSPAPPPNNAHDDFDPFSFGQLLAATVALQPLFEVCKLTVCRRRDLWRTVAYYPKSLFNGIVFIVTGHRNPWKKILKEREERSTPFDHDALPMHYDKEYKPRPETVHVLNMYPMRSNSDVRPS
ncbi:hypothetical protein CPB85DRAFT_1362130 [Mucidula mucida]|nr:hypothetical protein CPB85DRAFT_1362130 [Mucidula mucida]